MAAFASVRIVLFSQYFPPEVGATQTRMEVFARRLAALGHRVTVIAELPNHPVGQIFDGWRGRPIRRTHENGYEVVRTWVYTSTQKSFVRRIAFYATYSLNAFLAAVLVVRRRPAVVFGTSPPLPVLLAAWGAAAVWRRPLVIDIRDIWPAVGVALGELRGQRSVRLAQRLERFLYRKSTAITAVTEGFVAHIVESGASPAKVHLLPNGTVPELFDPERVDESLRGRLGVEDSFVVGYVGLHGIAQGLPPLIDAAAALADDPRFRFLFVGEGPVKSALVDRARSRGLENVVFHSQVPLDEIAPFINACDVMVVPLRALEVLETFVPSKLFDFMCSAKPVILMVDGEARRILDRAGAGLYVPAEDSRALAAAIRELEADPERAAAMGRSGREFVLAHYVREQQADRLDVILRAAASRSPAS